MSTLPGQAVRQILSEGKHIQEIVHFGHEQVFPGLTTYTCLLIGTKAPMNYITIAMVDNLSDWREHGTSDVRTLSSEEITAAPWSFVPDDARDGQR